MQREDPVVESGDAADLNAFLDERLHAFNVAATGLSEAIPIHAQVRDAAGAVLGAISGFTWGGCCEVALLWVHEEHRGQRIGTALLEAVEAEAARRGCAQVTLSTHSFQAPGFYSKLRYQQVASIVDYPLGHAKIHYVKRLETPASGASR